MPSMQMKKSATHSPGTAKFPSAAQMNGGAVGADSVVTGSLDSVLTKTSKLNWSIFANFH